MCIRNTERNTMSSSKYAMGSLAADIQGMFPSASVAVSSQHLAEKTVQHGLTSAISQASYHWKHLPGPRGHKMPWHQCGLFLWGRATDKDQSIANPFYQMPSAQQQRQQTAEQQQTAAPPQKRKEPEMHPASPQHAGKVESSSPSFLAPHVRENPYRGEDEAHRWQQHSGQVSTALLQLWGLHWPS